jgi:hypothetical protein
MSVQDSEYEDDLDEILINEIYRGVSKISIFHPFSQMITHQFLKTKKKK